LAGEVDHHLPAPRHEVARERLWRDHGVPTGVVRDRERGDPRLLRERAGRDELGGDDEPARPRELLAEGHSRGGLHAPAAQTADAVRQLSGTYCVRATSEYGHGLTIARSSNCAWRSTTGFAEPPFSSPQTSVTSAPSTASESIVRSLKL